MKTRVGRSSRILALGASVLAVGLVLAGCSGGGGSSDGSGKPNNNRPANQIHVLVLGDAAAKAEKAAAERFNKTSSVKVVVDTGATSGSDYTNAVRQSAGTASAPDISMSWGSAGIKPLIDAGALMNLNDFIKQDPKLKSSFIPSVFNEEVVNGKAYGIPMRGVAPTFLFYNKKVLAAAGLKPATTWDELQQQVTTLAKSGVTPIGLGGADKWPTQMWFQYAFDRVVGPATVKKGLAGDATAWSSDASKTALKDLKGLVDSGAFGKNFSSVNYSGSGSPALMAAGKSAYELMGTWNYGTLAGLNADFVKNDLGWVAFPSIGSDNAKDVAGNLSNYYNVAADTRYPDTVRKFLGQLYSDEFLKDELALGNLPPTTNAADLVAADSSLDATNKEYLTFVVNLVKDAPAFQLSWDQAVPAASQTPIQNAMADYFNGTIDANGWISAVQAATKK